MPLLAPRTTRSSTRPFQPVPAPKNPLQPETPTLTLPPVPSHLVCVFLCASASLRGKAALRPRAACAISPTARRYPQPIPLIPRPDPDGTAHALRHTLVPSRRICSDSIS